MEEYHGGMPWKKVIEECHGGMPWRNAIVIDNSRVKSII